MDLIKITDLSAQLGLSSRTLRYYEEAGLITSIRPQFEAYRFYDETAVERLRQIMVLRKMQIPIKDIVRIYENPEIATLVDVFVGKINEIDGEATALSELKNIINTFLKKMIESGIKKISALPLLYDEMDKQLELMEAQKPVTYETLESVSEKLLKPIEPAIISLPAMRMLSSFLKDDPKTSDIDGFWHYVLSQDIKTGTPGLHEQFEYQTGNSEAVMLRVTDSFVNDSDYLDISFDGGLYAAANVYVDEDLGACFRLLIRSFDDNKFYEIDYTPDGNLRHQALLENLISPDEKRELVSLLVPVKKRLANPALFDKPVEISSDSITIEEVEAQNPVLWERDVPLDKLVPINSPHYRVLESGEGEYTGWISTRVLSTDTTVKLPFRVDIEYRVDFDSMGYGYGDSEGSIIFYHGRELKALGIEVRFEKEKINSLSEDGELMLTLLASFAQEESRSISENVKWGIRKNFQKGIGNSFHIYGYRWTGKEFVIVEEEAKIVRLIYENYLNGISAEKTEKQLEEMGVKSYTGGHFGNTSIRQILQQERYTGNTLFQKTYTDTFGSGKTKYNNGELPQYYARNTQPAIISEETFNKVQEIRQKKRELGAFANPHIKTNTLTSKIKCKHCNRSFQRTSRKLVNGRSRYWICATRKAGQGNPCGTGDLHEEQLKKIINEVLGVDEFDDELFLEKVDHIEVTGKDLLEFFMTDGSVVTRTYVSTARRDAWTPEYKERYKKIKRSKDTSGLKNPASPYTGFIRCGRCGNSFYGQKLTLKDGTKVCYLRCRTKLSECPSNTIQESTLNALVCDVLGLEEYDEAAMDKAMDSCEIADNAVSFHFRDGHFEKRSYEEKKRGTPWTEERRQKALKGMKEYWSDPEHRKQASERMKKIRREKKWSSQ